MIAIWSLMDRRLGAQSGIALIQPSRWHEEIPDSFFRLRHIRCVLSPAGLHNWRMVMKTAECQFESLEDMRNRLGSSGAVEQIKAVQKSIKLINSADGVLDYRNGRAAIYHFAVALLGARRAPEVLASFGE